VWAALGGHLGITNLLLAREDVNPNTEEIEHGRTPLGWAVYKGHEGVVKLLLDRVDIDLNIADTKCRRTPLGCATMGGHGGMVKLRNYSRNSNAPFPPPTPVMSQKAPALGDVAYFNASIRVPQFRWTILHHRCGFPPSPKHSSQQ